MVRWECHPDARWDVLEGGGTRDPSVTPQARVPVPAMPPTGPHGFGGLVPWGRHPNDRSGHRVCRGVTVSSRLGSLREVTT